MELGLFDDSSLFFQGFKSALNISGAHLVSCLFFFVPCSPLEPAMSTFAQFLSNKETVFRQISSCFSMIPQTIQEQVGSVDRAFKALSSLSESLGRNQQLQEINKFFQIWVAAQKWIFTHISAAVQVVGTLSTSNCAA